MISWVVATKKIVMPSYVAISMRDSLKNVMKKGEK